MTSDELPSNLVCADSTLSEAGPGFLVGFMEARGGVYGADGKVMEREEEESGRSGWFRFLGAGCGEADRV